MMKSPYPNESPENFWWSPTGVKEDRASSHGAGTTTLKASVKLFYHLKLFLPRKTQIWLRRQAVKQKCKTCSGLWPVDATAGLKPGGWPGWPDGKQFALILTHDVETMKGQQRCYDLMDLEIQLDFRSSFNFVPERYQVCPFLRRNLISHGFEVGVHGLYHDGRLYSSWEQFRKRALQINTYLRDWEATGFRSPAMHHNLDWLHELDIEYDASTFDTDPFEPQCDGAGVIFPFWVPRSNSTRGFVELPCTLPQDFTLFVLLQETSIDIWKRKLDWIVENEGMALVNTHPDYLNFNQKKQGVEEYPAEYYVQFLEYIKYKYEGRYWLALPRQASSFLRESLPGPCASSI